MKRMTTALFAVLLGMCACSGNISTEKDNPYKPLSLSTRQSLYASEGSSFSTSFINKIEEASKTDYVVSPLSLQFLLGMILDGAVGQTADEISTLLGYGKGEVKEVNEYCYQMLTQLPDLDKLTKLTIANAIIVDDGYPLLKEYKTEVEKYYDAQVSNLDFSQGKASADKINKWCSDHTEGLIPKILDETTPDMLAYLLNAMYFKSKWSSPFPKKSTAEEDFTLNSGVVRKVRMMKTERHFNYMENKVFQAVSMPYGNGAFSMMVFRPEDGYTVSDVTSWLAGYNWDEVRNSFYSSLVDLWLPRFETKYHVNLNDILSDMGMPSAFSPKVADFTRMSDYALCLSFVNQDAVIKVDESGTEAAVISSAGMLKATSVQMPEDRKVFHADKPFLYIITEKSTGAILFAGRYSGE